MKKSTKQRIIASLLTSTLFISLCSCNNKNDNVKEGDLLAGYSQSVDVTNYNFKDGTAVAPDLYDRFTSIFSENAINILKSSLATKDNKIYSVISSSYSLASAANGASGTSLKALKSYLGEGMSLNDLNDCFKYLYTRLTTFNTEKSYISLLNSIYVSDEKEVKNSFLKKYIDNYTAEIFETSYSKYGSEKINQWFNEQNNTSESNIVSNASSTDEIYLLNSVNVNLAWINGYSESQIKNDVFNGTDNEQNVKYLCSTERYFTDSKSQGFIKSLADSTCKFVVIVPNEDVSLDEYIMQLNGENFINLINSNESLQFANIEMPSFSINTNVTYKDILSNYGIKDEFTSSADFTNICSKNLYINNIYQTISFEISESGIMPYTEDEKTKNDTMPSYDSVETTLKINRPFIFAVIDNETNAPVIIGTIYNIN